MVADTAIFIFCQSLLYILRLHILYKFGFGFVWENQRVQNPETFIKAFKQRLIDCHSQNWHGHISNSTRFTIYRMFKISISLEPYFTSVTNKHIRDILIRFRIGASNMRTHKLRYVAHTPGDLMCPLCNTAYEDEMHTLLQISWWPEAKIYSQKIYCATFLCYS